VVLSGELEVLNPAMERNWNLALSGRAILPVIWRC